VLVSDDDLGRSGTSAEGRHGFQRLVAEVGLDHVGLILGVEMSRLARSSKDWHPLLEICALVGTLIADLDGIYAPSQYNDRLLLGLKGTMSEAELHLLKQRMYQGTLQKEHRGARRLALPSGYVHSPAGEVVYDPDEQVQHVVHLIFRKFDELGTLHALLRYLRQHNIALGIRLREGPATGTLEWRRPHRMTVQNLLKNPLYAGAYASDRRQVDAREKQPGRPSTGRVTRPRQAYHAFLKNRVPAYITWAQYERNLARLEANRARAETVGAVAAWPLVVGRLISVRQV
jgi:DNA invertase Pin-like site-specific DNA recombinase